MIERRMGREMKRIVEGKRISGGVKVIRERSCAVKGEKLCDTLLCRVRVISQGLTGRIIE